MEQPVIVWGFDVRYVEFFVSLIGTISTIVIAGFAGRIAYLQNNGKRPLVLERSQNYDAKSAPPGHMQVTLTHQVWNRRTYAVRLDGPRIVFDNAVLTPSRTMGKDSIMMTERRVHSLEKDRVIESGRMTEFKTQVWVKVPAVEDLKEAYALRIGVYDPMNWRPKTTLHSRGMLYPSKAFRQPLKSATRTFLSRLWLIGSFVERNDEWFDDGGRDGIKSAEIFERWKVIFNQHIN